MSQKIAQNLLTIFFIYGIIKVWKPKTVATTNTSQPSLRLNLKLVSHLVAADGSLLYKSNLNIILTNVIDYAYNIV